MVEVFIASNFARREEAALDVEDRERPFGASTRMALTSAGLMSLRAGRVSGAELTLAVSYNAGNPCRLGPGWYLYIAT